MKFNINNYEFIPFNFNGIKKMVYKNFNLSIFLDDYCNADCKFCVAQLRYETKGLMYQKEHIENDETYLNRLEEVLKYIRPLNPSISITGGEPTMSSRLVKVLRLIDKYNFRKRVITTNGSGLLKIIEGKNLLQHIIDNNFDHLNISRISYCENKNKEIMRYNCNKNYCSNQDLAKIISQVKNSKLKIRLSCILLKDSINDLNKIKEYITFYKNLGINNFIFRELMGYEKESVNKEKIEYCDLNKIKLIDIKNELNCSNGFNKIKDILGYYYCVEIYKYKNCIIATESADLKLQNEEIQRNKDIIYEMVFHTNGNLTNTWVPEEGILLNYLEVVE